MRRSIHTVFKLSKAVAAIVTLCFVANVSWAGSARAKDCQLQRLASIDFAIVRDRVLVPVTVNDHAARMQLDTADIATVLWSDDAKKLGVSTHAVPGSAVINYGKTRITQFATVASFSLGSVKFGKGEFLLVPRDAFGPITVDEPVIGGLGLDALGKVDFELDFANSKLNLYSQDHCPGAVVYWTDKYSSARITRGPLGNYYFPMELDGKKIESTISTGTPGNSITTDVTKHLYHFDEKSEDIETETDPMGRSVSHYRAMALTGDGIKITNARIRLITDKRSYCSLTSSRGSEHAAIYEGCMGGEAPLKLGLSVARHLHLYFATKEKVLYFSDADASK